MIKSLLWKEWHEQRWKMAFGSVLLMGFCAISLNARMLPDEAVVIMTTLLGMSLLPIFSAMSVVGKDRSEGTLEHLLGLPVKPPHILHIKMLLGFTNFAVPYIGAFVVVLILAGNREISHARLWPYFWIGFWFAINLWIWTIAFGIGQSSEYRIGMIGLAVLVFWVLLLWIIAVFFFSPPPAFVEYLLGFNPVTLIVYMDQSSSRVKSYQNYHLLEQLLTLGILYWWAMRRFAGQGRSSS